MHRFLFAIVVVALIIPAVATGQTVKGIVLDASRQPIEDAQVSLLDPSGAEVRSGVRSDAAGLFVIHAITRGRYRVRVMRIGFQPVTSPELELEAAESVSLELAMTTVVQALPAVRILERRALTLTELMSTTGFELRRSKGLGGFLTAEELAGLGEFSNIVRTSKLAGLELRPGDETDVIMLRKAGSYCRPDYYLDGMIISNGIAGAERAMLTLGAMPMDHLYGIEMHRGDDLPPSLGGMLGSTGNPCGTIAVWTRAAAARVVLTGTPEENRRVVFRGVVIDDSAHAPLSNVTVELLRENFTPAGPIVRTDSLGRFRMQVDKQGRYRLRASRIGYHQVSTPSFVVAEGEVTGFEVVMSHRVQVLAPLTITERYRPSARAMLDPMEGFEFRKRLGTGTFFDRKALEARNALRVTDVLRGLAGVRVAGGQVRFARSLGSGGFGDGQCPPAVFMNGTILRIDPMETLDQLQMDQVIAIEVYRGPSQTPAEFSGTDSACGAIAVWTIRGR
jgi:hypothetical protein